MFILNIVTDRITRNMLNNIRKKENKNGKVI